MRRIATYCLLLIALPLGVAAHAQEAPKNPSETKAEDTAITTAQPGHFYRLDFVIEELSAEGKPINSRNYSATVCTDRKYPFVEIRAGSKVPIATSSNSGESAQQRTEFQYQDIGVNIDIHSGFTQEVGDELSFNLTMDVSSLASTMHLGGPNGPEEPVVRQNKWSGPALVPIGKSTTVFTSDNLDDKGALRVLVTATPLQ
jgi:hypothetical protein